MGFFKRIRVLFQADTSQVDAAGQKIQKDMDKVDKDIDDRRTKIAAMWSYGNQIANMLLSQLSQVAEGTKAAAVAQGAINFLQIVQTEIAIQQTVLQATAAFNLGNVYQGYALLAIATGMQTALARAQGLRQQQQAAERKAEEIRKQIETYRS